MRRRIKQPLSGMAGDWKWATRESFSRLPGSHLIERLTRAEEVTELEEVLRKQMNEAQIRLGWV